MRQICRIPCLLALCGVLLPLISCAAAKPHGDAERAQALFDKAIALRAEELQASAYKGGNARSGAAVGPSTALFEEAARLFEAASIGSDSNGGADSSPDSGDTTIPLDDYSRSSGETWWYEAANAWWWAGQSARAVSLYRRHLALHPFHGAAWENLAEARRDAGTLDPGGETLLDWPWHIWLGAGAALFSSFALSFLALHAFLGRAAPGARRSLRAAIGLGSLALVCTLALPLLVAFERPVVVLLAPAQGRMGDGDVYAPRPEAPWKAGQEGRLVAERAGWICMKVGSVESWVPADRVLVTGTSEAGR